MKEEIFHLVKALCLPGVEDPVLDILCQSACERLDGLLADGVTAEDCANHYTLAAAWLVMDWLNDTKNWEGVTSLSAGDMTVRREVGGKGGALERRAMAMMAPYLRDRNFVFQGVRG